MNSKLLTRNSKPGTRHLKSYFNKNLIEAGCDEAGRGCLAGPVYAAAVILPADYTNPKLNDSKKLSEKQRYLLREEIKLSAIAWAIGWLDNNEIDKINILQASIKSMHIALNKLKTVPEFILVDGNYFQAFKSIPNKNIIKGDSKYLSIAAASIMAKTYRDDYMKSIHNEFPDYLWSRNKGYPTKAHRMAISQTGISSYHRKSFKLMNDQMKLEI
jgi:ribonuclease HII